jgi:hypothetical protein
VLANSYNIEYLSDSLDSIITTLASKLNLLSLLKEIRNSNNLVRKMFEFAVELDEEDGVCYYYALTQQVTGGKIFIRKKNVGIEDKDIELAMIQACRSMLYNSFSFSKDVSKPRLNELADMFGAVEARKERSWSKKLSKLSGHYQKLIEERKLVIKDVELFKRFLNWNVLYIKHGKLPAMANIAKLKIMMRNGAPIYSIKEEQV